MASGGRPTAGAAAPAAEPGPPNLRGAPFRALALLTLAWTFVLVVVGVVVRVTGSGLGCPDWPLCHGQLIPPLEGPILVEYSHRLSASVAITLAALTAIVAWRAFRDDPRIVVLAAAALGLFLVQAVLGGITVLLDLPPTIVTAHLATAEALLAILTAVALLSGATGRRLGRARAVYVVAAGAVYTLILTGAHVRGSGASLACLEWPLCGTLLPADPAQIVHVAHRYVAALVAVLVGAAVVTAWRERLRLLAVGSGALFAVEVLVGATYVWTGGAVVAQAAHLATASAAWCALVALATTSALRAGADEPSGSGLREVVSDYVALTKPPVISLLVLTALGGMFVAAGGPPPLGTAAAVLIGGALGAGGANAVNQYLDRDIDELMARTRRRPLPGRRVAPRDALAFGIGLNVVSFAVLALGANLLAAAITLGASLFYIFVYTLWLKRTTVQNIVIGGAAGAVPPVVGWAAIAGDLSLPAYYLFAIVFFWTPAHFWALALLLRDDYDRARVPMLPVVAGERATAWGILLYSLALVALTVLLFTTRAVGLLYLAAALVLGIVFVAYALQYLREARRAIARRIYLYSMLYLALLFAAMMVDATVRAS